MTTIEQLYDRYLQHPSVQTDTRLLKKGDIFFALKGPNFNGNTFAPKALEMGAAYAVVDEPPAVSDDLDLDRDRDRLLLVPDVLRALQDLALHHRRQFDIPFIAITGSNGKTTTKELLHAVLSSEYITYTTHGNLNNHIGVPLTILSVRKDAEFAVIEMGANHQKEIESYCRYALPTHGIITNIGRAHLEGFGGPEGVKKGKGELYDHLRDEFGTAFVLKDSADLRQMSRGIPHIITYGTEDADFIGHVAPSKDSLLNVEITKGATTGTIHTQLVGDYNLPNVLVTPSNSRSQLIERDGNHIILDAYNANPSSMRAAIENFAQIQVDHPKVLILGAMAELGPESLNEHRAIVDLIGQHPWQQVALVGGDFLKLQHPYLSFANSREAGHWLKGAGLKDTWLLIKGSRSSKMEEALNN
jgi:UDP-N-acetylmuramoyl-tripeptide--D-alanyl-D-alanine ligase